MTTDQGAHRRHIWAAALKISGRITVGVVAVTIAALSSDPARADKWSEPYSLPSATGQLKKAAKSSRAKSPKGVQVASLGNTSYTAPAAKKKLSGGGGGINWAANSSCLNSSLRSLVQQVAASYGPVTVNSTCRSASHNRSVGGAPKSYHLTGNAVDFRVHGNASGAATYIRSRVGGYQNKGGGLFHVDTGPRRPMG